MMKRSLLLIGCCLLTSFLRAEMKPNFIDYMLSEERYEQVVRLTTAQLERHPKDGRLYTQRATAYLQQDELQAAVDDLSRAIRYRTTADKSLADLYQMRGVLYELLENPKAALRDYSRLIKLTSHQPEGYQLRGELYQQMGQADKARRDLEKAQQLQAQ